MEQDMLNIQRAWYPQQEYSQVRSNTANFETKSIQVATETHIVSVQTDPYTCCLNEKVKSASKETKVSKEIQTELDKPIKSIIQETNIDESSSSTIFKEQLDEALKVASERSETLDKCESQLAEYKAKVDALNKTMAEKDLQYQAKLDSLNKLIEERDTQYQVKMDALNKAMIEKNLKFQTTIKAIEEKDLYLAQKQTVLDESMTQPHVISTNCTDKLALKSTITSLQKLLNQKEETILRYQNLLKEDRDEHSRAASRFQDEIKSLHDRILTMQSETKKTSEELPVVTVERILEKPLLFDETTSRITWSSRQNNAAQEEETARLHEKISTLEAELNISKELSERWHRLAEERLKYIDHMRERFV